MRTITLPAGETIPVLGQGTWGYAEVPGKRASEIATLRTGLDLGMTLVDTAEMYADGAAESLVGEAIGDRRDEVFLVSKVLPHHATRAGTIAACEHSLRRLRTDVIDLYLLHWRGPVPLQETIDGFAALVAAGRIRHWGVSNFDISDMLELTALPGGGAVQTDQVLYNLTRRGVERDLLPWCVSQGLPIMAYSPLERGRILGHPGLAEIARELGVTPAQLALAWVLRMDGINAVPKASTPERAAENRAALDLVLSDAVHAALDRLFPPPSGLVPLEVI